MEVIRYSVAGRSDRMPLRVMITDNQDGIGAIVAGIIKDRFSRVLDSRTFFTRCAERLDGAARQFGFDLFVLNLEMICFPSKRNFRLSRQYRRAASLDLIRRLREAFGVPLIVLYCWQNPQFKAAIEKERYAFAIPCSVHALRRAVTACVKEAVMKNSFDKMNTPEHQRGHSILIVDNDRDVLKVSRSFFERGRFTVYTVCSAEEALGFLNEHSVDIVLTDVFMSGINGLELTRMVRKLSDADVIVMTGAVDIVSSREALAAGASFFFPKPVRFTALLEAAWNLIKARNKNR